VIGSGIQVFFVENDIFWMGLPADFIYTYIKKERDRPEQGLGV
jgi:hypothetical protein